MTDETHTEGKEVVAELKQVGQQLRGLFETAWESEKRQELETEFREGISSLGTQIEDLAKDIGQSEEMARLRSEAKEIRDAARTGKLGTTAREEFLKVLRVINAELQKLRDTWAEQQFGTEDSGVVEGE